MPINPSKNQDTNAKDPSAAESCTQEQIKTHPNHNISELATHLHDLQTENHSQSSEIAHLKRQLKLLSEFKGFSVDVSGGVRLRSEFQLLWDEAQSQSDFTENCIGTIDSTAINEGTMDHSNNNTPNKGSYPADQSDSNPNKDSNLGSINSTGSDDPLGLTVNPFLLNENKYDDLDDEQLEEFAKIASPKMSELLNEQALVLDDLVNTPGWSSSDSEDDYSGSYNSRKGGKRKGGRNKSASRRTGGEDGDEDSMNEEWNQLEAAQMDLKDELEAATNGFAQMMYGDGEDGDYARENSSGYEHFEGEGGAESKNDADDEESWRDSIHQYYTDNNQSTEGTNTTNPGTTLPALPSKPNHSYSLADHALTLDVSRPVSDRGLYKKPLLSRNELETLGIVTMPSWIARPSGEVSSRGRENYMKRILNCTVEYIEPPKSTSLRRLFSGWNPGPGERKPGDEGSGDMVVSSGERVANNGRAGDDSQRVTSYSFAKNNSEDSSVEEDPNEGFEHVDGFAYASPTHRVIMEPLPVRTVTIRIRCDVMCGAVMDALTTSVERVGGEITKRQGGHLRAVLPGRKMRVWMPGEWERENRGDATPQGESKDIGDAEDNGYNVVDSPISPRCSQPDLCHANNDDAASVASGFSTILSPIFGTSHSKQRGPTYDVLPPYILDSQLVTKKVGKECQRLVLIRIYRMQDVARVRSTLGDGDDEEAFDLIAPLDSTCDGALHNQQHDSNGVGSKTRPADPLLESKRNLKGLQEAAALVQRIKSGSGFAIDPPVPGEGDAATVSSHTSTKSYFKSFGDAITSPVRYFGGSSSSVSPMKPSNSSGYSTVMDLMSNELLRKHVSSPSVGTNSKSALAAAKQKSNGIFPALSKEDKQYVKSSWMFLRDCIEELDRRCLAYSTLGIYPIFQFPALPTLDVHFNAQIKSFCRDSMIVSLVKTASELEIYAREFEISCGNVDQLLRPTFEMYKLAPVQLPTPVPLTAYPLDFRAPEEISPPWGPDVMTALEKISNELSINSTENDKTKTQLSSFERSEKAVSIIVAAFQKQNDVEQGARLGRKNMQVMDRLAKMQAHKRNSITKIRDSYGSNLLATRAADQFHSLRQKSSNIGSLSDVMEAVPDEVPLLMCNVLVGNAAGTCYVTHSHVLFNTQLVPILGGSKIHLFSIMDVEVTINAPSKSMLSPLPASISFTTEIFGRRSTTREEVYNFIPSIGARRFAKFMEVLRDVALEDPDSLKFSDKGGLIYLAD